MLSTLSPYVFPNSLGKWLLKPERRWSKRRWWWWWWWCVCVFVCFAAEAWNAGTVTTQTRYVWRAINTFVCICNGDGQTDRQTDRHTREWWDRKRFLLRVNKYPWRHDTMTSWRGFRPLQSSCNADRRLCRTVTQLQYTGWVKKVSCCTVMDISKARQ